MAPRLPIPATAVAEICRRFGVHRLSLFGSVLTDRFGPDSDVDMLVEFRPEVRIGLFGMAALQQELTRALGRRVDLRTPGDLSRYFRDDVVRSAQVQYAA